MYNGDVQPYDDMQHCNAVATQDNRHSAAAFDIQASPRHIAHQRVRHEAHKSCAQWQQARQDVVADVHRGSTHLVDATPLDGFGVHQHALPQHPHHIGELFVPACGVVRRCGRADQRERVLTAR